MDGLPELQPPCDHRLFQPQPQQFHPTVQLRELAPRVPRLYQFRVLQTHLQR